MTYSVKDFYTKTKHETSSKMALFVDEKDTGAYLMVIGIEARSIAQDRLKSQKAFSMLSDKIEKIEDGLEKRIFERDESEKIKIELASVLVSGWSFVEEFNSESMRDLLSENVGLSDSIIAHASSSANYFKKKH